MTAIMTDRTPEGRRPPVCQYEGCGRRALPGNPLCGDCFDLWRRWQANGRRWG